MYRLPVDDNNVETRGVQQAREQMRLLIDAALERGQRTIITRAGRKVAVLVPYEWYAAQVGPESKV